MDISIENKNRGKIEELEKEKEVVEDLIEVEFEKYNSRCEKIDKMPKKKYYIEGQKAVKNFLTKRDPLQIRLNTINKKIEKLEKTKD